MKPSRSNVPPRQALHRRQVLAGAAGLSLAALLALAGSADRPAAEGLELGPPRRIDYAAYQHIRFLPGNALGSAVDGPFPIQLFHLACFFQAPVSMQEVKDAK